MNDSPEDRTAKWLVGDRLACVLHLGDTSLAYQLAEQGHEVVVAGDDVTASRHEDIQYVRSQGERLPFLADAFDVVIAPELREAPTALAEYARVLRPDGLLSTISQRYDDSIPWMRKLREITGDRGAPTTPVDTFSASGLFHEPETHEFGTWEKLDLPGLLRFAEATPASLGRRVRPVAGARPVHELRRPDRLPAPAPRDVLRTREGRQVGHGARGRAPRHNAARLPLNRPLVGASMTTRLIQPDRVRGSAVLLQTIVADVRSNVDHTRRAGLSYWARVIGKLVFAPAVQVVVIYRISSLLYRNPVTRPLAFALRGFTIVWGGTEIHPSAKIGPGFCLVHSQKILIGEDVVIGRNARISHGCSIGGDVGRGASEANVVTPVIGDNVTIALDSIVLGGVTIGDGAVVSAQSLVVRDVAAYTIVAGSPARLVRMIDDPAVPATD